MLKVPLPRQSILLIIVVDSSTQADKVLQRLKNGEDFAALAKELSIDPTASDGGSMGRVNPAALRAELRDAIKRLSIGEISPVIHTHSGSTGDGDALARGIDGEQQAGDIVFLRSSKRRRCERQNGDQWYGEH